MTGEEKRGPLLIVCGPTASGKTKVATALAKAFSGEVISADSMQIYKKMDIGTAKPTNEEKDGICHYMLDFLEPSENYSVARFVEDAKKCYDDIRAKGKLPILAGGTGLYIDSFVRGAHFAEVKSDHELRTNLSSFAKMNSNTKLLKLLAYMDPKRAKELHENDVKRVVRAIEFKILSEGEMVSDQDQDFLKREPLYQVCGIFLNYRDRKKLYERINLRVDKMVELGLLEETRALLGNPKNKKSTAMQAIGYKEMIDYLEEKEDFCQAVERIKLSSRRYAKRQLTWFRRDKSLAEVFVDDYNDFSELFSEILKIVEKSGIV